MARGFPSGHRVRSSIGGDRGSPIRVLSQSGRKIEPVGIRPSRRPLIEVTDLAVHFETSRGLVRAVDGVSFSVGRNERLGLVGESGCGKTVTTRALMRQIPPSGRIAGGRILWKGKDMAAMSDRDIRRLRGAEMVVVPQDPMTSLNPVFTVGNQVAEPMMSHLGYRRAKATKEAARYLNRVRIPQAERRIGQFPFEFSGGMRQRALIAMGLTCDPELIIADEPTTALDMTVQSQILAVLSEEQRRTGAGLILVTHDLSLIAKMCERMAVMYAGRIVEHGPTRDIFRKPVHPYTEALLRSLPVPGDDRKRLYSIEGQPPDPLAWPDGCRFEPRCPHAFDKCAEAYPDVEEVSVGHRVACLIARSRAEGGPGRG